MVDDELVVEENPKALDHTQCAAHYSACSFLLEFEGFSQILCLFDEAQVTRDLRLPCKLASFMLISVFPGQFGFSS